jgi:hypothetical protein
VALWRGYSRVSFGEVLYNISSSTLCAGQRARMLRAVAIGLVAACASAGHVNVTMALRGSEGIAVAMPPEADKGGWWTADGGAGESATRTCCYLDRTWIREPGPAVCARRGA